MTDAIQLHASEMKMTQKSDRVYSPVLSCERPIAAKATTAIAVAPNSGPWFSAIVSRIAAIFSRPPSIRTLMPSVMTIALSVSMHSAMMNAPSEMRSRRMPPFRYMVRNVARIVKNSTRPTESPAREAHGDQQQHEDDGDRLDQVEDEGARRLGDRGRLEVDLADLDADRLLGAQLVQLLLHGLAHGHDVAAAHRRDAEADGRLAVEAQQPARRVLDRRARGSPRRAAGAAGPLRPRRPPGRACRRRR